MALLGDRHDDVGGPPLAGRADALLGPVDVLVSTPGMFPGSTVGSTLTSCTGCLDIAG